MAYAGAVPQEWVDRLAPYLSKDRNQGKVIAEQLLRAPDTRPALVKAMRGVKINQAEQDTLPAEIVAAFGQGDS